VCALLSQESRRRKRFQTLHDPVIYKTREAGDFILNDVVPEPDGGRYR
jgi:hypothetical protein